MGEPAWTSRVSQRSSAGLACQSSAPRALPTDQAGESAV
ncbi:hypothetical protein BLL52_1599 [Rhodoferax antarcticus ANT.BR]|uniref:Uncharacterized protein n=1 Tax=Rhodoferax antarcticus ANT.BR TaxID=1111071 RepID=A0A1Q8YFS2_9BURK|nr:hypothetical protein BLL52_1599 [Rhodoferax antarcticus ANT.BR]